MIKADGLAAGKGVFVCRTQAEVEEGLRGASELGEYVVIEELLEGPELSVFALTDGLHALPLAAARDHKRVGDGDTGPNTGGMGAFSPVPPFDRRGVEELVEQVHRPVLDELARRGTPFIGLLYAGLMLTDEGPRVLEFNCRFGDPETQVILPRSTATCWQRSPPPQPATSAARRWGLRRRPRSPSWWRQGTTRRRATPARRSWASSRRKRSARSSSRPEPRVATARS